MPDKTYTPPPPVSLDGEVTDEQFQAALDGLLYSFGSYFREQRYCSEYWEFIHDRISPVFYYRTNDTMDGYLGTVDPDRRLAPSNVEELRDIRGRVLRLVGDRIDLAQANRTLRAAGLPEYQQDEQETRTWEVVVPRVYLHVRLSAEEENPVVRLRESFERFLADAGAGNPAQEAQMLITNSLGVSTRIPSKEVVDLL